MKILISFFIVAMTSFSMSNDEKIDEARDYMMKDYQRAIDITDEILSDDSDNLEALWIQSLSYSNLANIEEDESRQEEYFEKADGLADRAIEIDGNNADALHAKSVALGRKAEHAGARDGIRLSKEIKELSDKVLELDDTHEGAWFLRGMLMYRVANLSRMERLAANTLFGGVPFEAENEEAIEAVERAVELDPENIYFRLEFARILKDDGQTEKASEILEPTLELDPVTAEDKEHLERGRGLLDDL